MTDDFETRRRRAAYRAHHRGTKEMDFLIGRYADARLAACAPDELARLERLLAMPDPALQSWIFSRDPLDTVEFSNLIADIRAFHGLAEPSGTN